MKNKILALTILAFTSMNAMAQEEVNVTGIDRRYGKFYNFSIKGCSALDSDAV